MRMRVVVVWCRSFMVGEIEGLVGDCVEGV